MKLHNDYHQRVLFNIYVDGARVAGKFCHPGKTETVEGVDINDASYQPFRFGALQVTGMRILCDSGGSSMTIMVSDDDDALRGGVGWQDLGTLQITVLRVVEGTDVPVERPDFVSTISNDPVHERSKKAGTHRVA